MMGGPFIVFALLLVVCVLSRRPHNSMSDREERNPAKKKKAREERLDVDSKHLLVLYVTTVHESKFLLLWTFSL